MLLHPQGTEGRPSPILASQGLSDERFMLQASGPKPTCCRRFLLPLSGSWGEGGETLWAHISSDVERREESPVWVVGLLGTVRPMAPCKAVAETPHLGGHLKLQLEAGVGVGGHVCVASTSG